MNGRTRPNLLLLISVQTIPYSRWRETVTKQISCSVVCLLVCMPVGHECQPCKVQRNVRTAVDAVRRYMDSGAGRGRGKLPPYGWTSKNYVICVCFHCHGTSSYHTRQIHCKAVEQRATLIHRQYNRDWGTSYSRPPIDP